MPWKPFSQICREIEQLSLSLTPTAATELKGVFARRLGVNPSEISHAALLEVVRRGTPGCLEIFMRLYAREAKWLASGRRSPDGEREVIHPDDWAFLTIDIEHQIVRDLDGKLVYADLKGAFSSDLTEEEWQSVERQLAPPSPVPVLKAEGTVPTAGAPRRTHDVEANALLQNRIKGVLAKAKARWPNLQKRPGLNQMARLLVDGQPKSKVEDFGQDAIRKILAGTYKPAKNRSIPGLSTG